MGTQIQDPSQPPPCKACISQSRRLFAHAPTIEFAFQEDEELKRSLEGLSIADLSRFTFPTAPDMGIPGDIQLGKLVLPSMRWITRLHNLPENGKTRFLFREYLQSAWRVANEFVRFLDQVDPQVLVVFNGVLFPEATARWVAQQRGVRVITHEVAFKPFSGFFTDQQATAYPIEIPEDFQLSAEENQVLDEYLEQRFQGNFTMAGIQFWPEILQMGEGFEEKAARFEQIVPVFTNVIFDTSQIHANTVFSTMFEWLDLVLEVIKSHPETLFVIRAHPDELRKGKQSKESVPMWVTENGVDQLENVIFIPPDEYLSSYDLIHRSKLVLVYNSSIGLEASLMGKAVICGGKARYSDYETVYFPQTPGEYRELVEQFLNGSDSQAPPEVHHANARRFMYYQLFKASIPFGEFLENHNQPGYVRLKRTSWRQMQGENSATMRTLIDGIVSQKPFLMGSQISMTDRIELLSVSLLDNERDRIEELKDLAQRLKLEFGWHYLLDLSWILSQIDQFSDQTFMDAGAGTGVIQWYLAENGATVISVDRESRENLANRFRRRFTVEGMRPQDLVPENASQEWAGKSIKSIAADLIDQLRYGVGQNSSSKDFKAGKVIIYNQDLTNLADISDDSIDIIVAVSSLEHNSPEGLESVVAELMRVLRSGGKLLATLGASNGEDWFHEPSKGWCYSENTLRSIFHISSDSPSNYSEYELEMERLVNNQELKNNLSSFYYKSGDNGMPWGEWNPEYQPVGVCKVKNEAKLASH